MIKCLRTDNASCDFKLLISLLDRDLEDRYCNIQADYDAYNQIGTVDHVILAYENQKPVGCGCFKDYNGQIAEIKRMFVIDDYRGRGYSRIILKELELWAKESGYLKTILETGVRQPEAIGLYKKSGYKQIENYGPYQNMENSICFEKKLV